MTSEYLNDPFESREPEAPGCPICGAPLNERSWKEERGIVEIDMRCPVEGHYHYNWSYGRTEVSIGEIEWNYSNSTPEAEISRIETEIEAETQRLIAERTAAKT
jgi:hypothetical protein